MFGIVVVQQKAAQQNESYPHYLTGVHEEPSRKTCVNRIGDLNTKIESDRHDGKADEALAKAQ